MLLALSFNAQAAETLWGGSYYGMTPTDLKKVYRSAITPPKLTSTFEDGTTNLFVLNDYEIAKHKFDINFFFKNNSLTEVMFILQKEKNTFDIIDFYDQITLMLRLKYGNEIENKIEKNALYYFARKTWINREGLNIMLVTFLIKGNKGKPIFNIVYQYRISKEARKL
jgi:hypothetical protein